MHFLYLQFNHRTSLEACVTQSAFSRNVLSFQQSKELTRGKPQGTLCEGVPICIAPNHHSGCMHHLMVLISSLCIA